MRGRVVGNARLGKAAKHDQRITPPAAQGLGPREQIHQVWIVWPARLHGAPSQVVEDLVCTARSSVHRELTARFGLVAIGRCLPRVDDGRGGQERKTDADNKPAHANVRLTHPPIIEREIADSLVTGLGNTNPPELREPSSQLTRPGVQTRALHSELGTRDSERRDGNSLHRKFSCARTTMNINLTFGQTADALPSRQPRP